MATGELIAARRAEPWRETLHKSKKNKERADIPRVEMGELDPEYRSRTRLEEVNLGLTKEQAMQEAKRYLDCPNPTCMQECPVNINMPTFIKNIERGEFLEAAKTLRETSALPTACGRVYLREEQCESKRIHLKMGKEAVITGYLEHFAADYKRESGNISVPEVAEKNGIKIAVADSGPTELSFTGDIAKRGHDMAVFRALHEIGGVLKYGIPEFRLPDKIADVEIDGLRKVGVRFEKDCVVDRTISYDDLHANGFKGILVASGAGLPNFTSIPGENFVGVMPSNEYLTRVNLMGAVDPESDTPVLQGKKVAAIRGDNTTIDSVRTARRLSAERAMIIYRRSEEEMPARLEEVKHAKREDVEFMTLHNPIKYIGNERDRVEQIYLQKMELGKANASGHRRPTPIEGTIETIDVDEVIVSVGVSPNPLMPRVLEGLEVNKEGTVVMKEDSMRSALGDVYADSDIIHGGATVILAMGDGRKAATTMDADLRG